MEMPRFGRLIAFVLRRGLTVILLAACAEMGTEAQPTQPPIFPAETLASPSGIAWTYGSWITVKPDSRLDRILTALNIPKMASGGPPSFHLAVIAINGEDFYGSDSEPRTPEKESRKVGRFAELLGNSAGQSLRLVLGPIVGYGETVYDLQFDDWDNGMELGSGQRVEYGNVVRVSPGRAAQLITQALQSDKVDQAQVLVTFSRQFYSHSAGVIQEAVDQGTAGLVATRLQRARVAKDAHDWQQHTTILRQTLRDAPQSRDTIETLLSADLKEVRDLLRAGDGPRAVEAVGWIRTVLPDFSAAQTLQSEAKAQVVSEALKTAQASDAKGAFAVGQSVLVAALKIVPEDQQLQLKLAEIRTQLEMADRRTMADAQQGGERAAAGRREADLAEALSGCRSALNGKDYSSALERCGSLRGSYPQESATKALIARLRAETPVLAYRSHAEAEQNMALSETVPSSVAVGTLGNLRDWHGTVRMKTVDNYYVVATSSGLFVIRPKTGEPLLRAGQSIAVIGEIVSWPTIGTLGGRPQTLPMLLPERIDQWETR